MDRIFTVSAERNGAALTEMRAAPLGCLVGAAVGGTTSAGAGRMTSEASLLGVGNSAGDQLTGNTVGHLRQRRSSGGFSGWCGWWCRRRRRVPADAVGDSSKGSPDCRGNVGELRSDRCCDIVFIGPFCSVIRIVRTNAGTYRTRDVVSTPPSRVAGSPTATPWPEAFWRSVPATRSGGRARAARARRTELPREHRSVTRSEPW
jgi:hypothetical protein